MRLSRIVIDTNVAIAAMISRNSRPAKAIERALQSGKVLVSPALLVELEAVFRRPKLDRYSDLNKRLEYLATFSSAATPVSVTKIITACRDPKDNMILALALSGNADLIVTGDADLLSLHPWRGIPILSPADYLAQRL